MQAQAPPTFLLHLLHGPQLVDVVGVVEPQLHADEGLAALQAQLVPGFGSGQQVGNGALRQAQDGLAKEPLACRTDTRTKSVDICQ